ncbi:unnamed protein product [Phaeothamnion confervicola]
MPLFFILSGFSLSAVYGNRRWKAPSPWFSCCSKSTATAVETEHDGETAAASKGAAADESSLKSFDWRRFYRNRLARVGPVYYLLNLAAIPFWFAGFGGVAPDNYSGITSVTIVSLIPTSTVFSFALGSNLDGPAWTVVTLLWLWAYFPRWLPAAQRMTDDQLLRSIIRCYNVQMWLVLVFFYTLFPFVGFWIAFSTATMNPFVRFPVFLMGVYAGILCARHQGGAIPWTKVYCGLFPACPKDAAVQAEALAAAVPTTTTLAGDSSASSVGASITSSSAQALTSDVVETVADATAAAAASVLVLPESEQSKWAALTERRSIHLLALTLFVGVCASAAMYAGVNILGGVWLQAIVPFAQLEVVVGLTRDGGASRAAKVLLRPHARWLGKVGMSIYLVHLVLMPYLTWALYGGKLSWPEEFDCDGLESDGASVAVVDACNDEVDDWDEARLLPIWGIPVVAVASVGAAAAIFYGFEEPARKMLRV